MHHRFHPTAGPLIKFSNQLRTAERIKAKSDFDGGVVFSRTKLETNKIFQVRLEKKIGIWSGGLEIGVTCIDPNTLGPDNPLPRSVVELKQGTWILTSSTVIHDGQPILENYGVDLEKLEEGDTVGLMRTKQGSLIFFIQGVSQGVAVPFIPPDIYGVINLYGKCAMISLTDQVDHASHSEHTQAVTVPPEFSSFSSYSNAENNSDIDKLRFHPICGPLVKLSNNERTAERRRPLEEFNNCVVLTHRPLRNDELFQVRVDNLILKWSGSIEFGLITHSPTSFSTSDFPATLTVVGKGIVIMSGNGVLHDGKATNSPYYSNFNLDQLQEGDRIGVLRKSNGDVIYFVNGEPQGVATNVSCTESVWGCCNLYGIASKVTIVGRNEREEHNLRVTTRNPQDSISGDASPNGGSASSSDELLFHPNCGFHAAVINHGRTAHRPESMNDFNHGVVLTNRTLRPNEMFEIRLDRIVSKWAGNIEIGVTTHVPSTGPLPCTMTSCRTGTYMMTGNGIMHNGSVIIDDYGQSLDRLKVGDFVGVKRKENGNLHFYVNKVDQGCAVTVPEDVYGVIDLYGQAAQATIVSHTSETSETAEDRKPSIVGRQMSGRSGSGESMFSGDLKFHHLHGKNARISTNGLTACRPNALGEFNSAIVMSCRPLKDNELFEVVIERMVDRWSGSIEVGVTTISPFKLTFPSTMTEIAENGTIMLSGSSIMNGGNTITNRYPCNLDCLAVGSKVGMMRKSDGTLHFFINGEDIGAAPIESTPSNVYAVIDLYGQCSQVSITRIGDVSLLSSQVIDSLPFNDTSHRFSPCCGMNISLKNNNLTASRIRGYNHALTFSSQPLEIDEMFEIRITETNPMWAGTLMIGVTNFGVSEDFPSSHLPDKIQNIRADTWMLKDVSVHKNRSLLKDNYCMNLNRLSVGDKVGVKICQDKSLRFLVNGLEMGCAAFNMPKRLHVVIDLFGQCMSVLITSSAKTVTNASNECLQASQAFVESITSIPEDLPTTVHPGSSTSVMTASLQKQRSLNSTFSNKHSRNVELLNGNQTARRTSGYQAFVFGNNILQKGRIFEMKVDKVNPKYTSSLMIGVLECSPERIQFPFNSLGFRKACWLVIGDEIYRNGMKTSRKVEMNLNSLKAGHTIGLILDHANTLHLIGERSHSVIAKNVSVRSRALIVLYGEAEQITIIKRNEDREKMYKVELVEKPIPQPVYVKPLEYNLISDCEYLDACLRFKASLVIPDVFFVDSEPTVCFCDSCFKYKDPQELMCKQGDPIAHYSVPLGWVRFPINIIFDNLTTSRNQSGMTISTNSLSNVLTCWHVAYHGLEIYRVRDVMDSGQLMPSEWSPTFEEGKDEKSDISELVFSPILEYAANPVFSPTKPFFDTRNQRKLAARVALEVLVQPGSYKVGSAVHPIPKPVFNMPTKVQLDRIQWSSKEQGSTHVSALLVNIDGYFNNK